LTAPIGVVKTCFEIDGTSTLTYLLDKVFRLQTWVKNAETVNIDVASAISDEIRKSVLTIRKNEANLSREDQNRLTTIQGYLAIIEDKLDEYSKVSQQKK
jgi:hypothetical protein